LKGAGAVWVDAKMADSTRERKKSKKPSSTTLSALFLTHLDEEFNIDIYCCFISDTNFKQQRLKAWQPILTARTALPLFFLIGVVFIPIGSVLLAASDNVSAIRFLRYLCELKLVKATSVACKIID